METRADQWACGIDHAAIFALHESADNSHMAERLNPAMGHYVKLDGVPDGGRVVVAMSGGVDSSVTAALLRRSGYETVGVTLQLYDHGVAVSFPHQIKNFQFSLRERVCKGLGRDGCITRNACKLLHYFHQPFDDARLDPQLLQGALAAQLDQHLRNRETLADLDILDFRFENVVKSTESVIERIYQHAGLTFSDQARQKVRAWDSGNPIHKKGKFEYSLEEFGLTEAGIRESMAGYIAFIEALKH